MKHSYKYLAGIYLLSFGLLFTSCEKFLEESPLDAIPSDKAITDAGTAKAAIIGAYDAVQGYYAIQLPQLWEQCQPTM